MVAITQRAALARDVVEAGRKGARHDHHIRHRIPPIRLRSAGLAAIATGPGVPPLASAGPGDADAELIRLCGEIVAGQTRLNALYKVRRTYEDERRTEPELDALFARQHELLELIDGAKFTNAPR
jgi:hypothetical protein